jgi:hypothetical protein
MINRLTIRARLILLAGALLVVLIGTNLYLTRILANNSQAAARATNSSTLSRWPTMRASPSGKFVIGQLILPLVF